MVIYFLCLRIEQRLPPSGCFQIVLRTWAWYPAGHTSRCDIVCSSPHLQVIFWSPYPHFLLIDLLQHIIYSVSSKLASLSCGQEVIFLIVLSSFNHYICDLGFSLGYPTLWECSVSSSNIFKIFKEVFFDISRKVERLGHTMGVLCLLFMHRILF